MPGRIPPDIIDRIRESTDIVALISSYVRLEKYPGMKSFRYGRPEEGDFGVTIVEME